MTSSSSSGLPSHSSSSRFRFSLPSSSSTLEEGVGAAETGTKRIQNKDYEYWVELCPLQFWGDFYCPNSYLRPPLHKSEVDIVYFTLHQLSDGRRYFSVSLSG